MNFNLFSCFCDFLNEKGSYCSNQTLTFYSSSGLRFFSWLRDFKGVDLTSVDCDMFTKDLFVSYLSYLRSCNIKNTSIHTYFRGIKVFFSWLEERGVLMNESKNCKLPKKDASSIVPLSALEVKKIDSLFNLKTVLGIRNYCIFHLMLDCGLRRSEVIRLKDSDIDFELNLLHISGKGYKKRIVPLPTFLKSSLLRYRDYFRCEKLHDYFFCLNSGECLSVNSIKMFFERLKKRSGITRIHAHLLRHTFATSYIVMGGNLEFLRLLMGHSDYSITQNYLHIANTYLLMDFDFYDLDDCFLAVYRKGASV